MTKYGVHPFSTCPIFVPQIFHIFLDIWLWINTYYIPFLVGYSHPSIPAILMFTRGFTSYLPAIYQLFTSCLPAISIYSQGFDPSPYSERFLVPGRRMARRRGRVAHRQRRRGSPVHRYVGLQSSWGCHSHGG